MAVRRSLLNIPVLNDSKQIVIFSDEFHEFDYNDLIDVLRAELAPLQVWRSCALEYYRQGCQPECETILGEIVEALTDPIVDKVYSQKNDYSECKAEIYDALAAIMLRALSRMKLKDGNTRILDEITLKVIEFLRKSEDLMSLNEYTWLIKGFFELSQGEMKRAEDNFRAVHDRSAKMGKRKFQFGAVLGLACVAYHNRNYNSTLEHLCKAISLNPDCTASVRVAIAATCCHLKQFHRARYALDRALALDPSNTDALCLHSLIEYNESKDKSKVENNFSLDYSLLASSIDPTNAIALNHMAKHLLLHWKVFKNCKLMEDNVLLVHTLDMNEITKNDLIDIDSKTYIIQDIHYDSMTVDFDEKSYQMISAYITLNKKSDIKSVIFDIKVQELGKVIQLAQDCMKLTSLKSLRSESLYLIGRVFHVLGNIDYAFDYYRQSIREDSDMTLSQFEAAKILFSRGDFPSALEFFERIHQKLPDDKDTIGFLYLIRSITSQEVISMEKLKEVSNRFQYDSDLWLIQGFNRHRNPNEYANAIKCYNYAIESLRNKDEMVNPFIFNNLAVLNQSLNKLTIAYDNIVAALKSIEISTFIQESKSPISFHEPEFEEIYFKWTLVDGYLCNTENENAFVYEKEDTSMNEGGHTEGFPIKVGDEIMLNDDIVVLVTAIESNMIICRSPVLFLIEKGTKLYIKRKIFLKERLISDITISYNFARILEDIGKIKAASELFENILRIRPSFTDCYIHLSLINSSICKYNDASLWITKAEIVDGVNGDVIATQGDLYMKLGQLEPAKKCYEKLLAQRNLKDSRAIVSLGNLYFCSFGTKYESFFLDSYKYYFNILSEDKRNIFASVGLGMVFAERRKLDLAKEIFSRVREVDSCSNADIIGNLANVNCSQTKYRDAETLYSAALKNGSKLTSSQQIELQRKLAYAAHKSERFDDSDKTQLRSLHQFPMELLSWFNFASTNFQRVIRLFKQHRVSKADLFDCSRYLKISSAVYEFMYSNNYSISKQIGRDVIKANLQVCKEYSTKVTEICSSNDRLGQRTDGESSDMNSEYAIWALAHESASIKRKYGNWDGE